MRGLSSRVMLAASTALLLVFGGSALEVQGQADYKKDMLLRISQFVNGYENKQMFSKWICLGNVSKFKERIEHAEVKIAVETDLTSMAEYRPYYRSIILRHEPKKFIYSLDSAGDSSLLLWHEAIHAISHGHQTGAITPSRPFKSAPADIAPDASGNIKSADEADSRIDHFYINWAESCIGGTLFLVRLEKILKDNGKELPTGRVKDLAQRNWKAFVRECESSAYGQVPDEEEKAELERMIGFRCDPNEVLNGYLSLGYPIEYFGDNATDEAIWKLFPTSQQAGATDLEVKQKKSQLGKLSATYIKSWTSEPNGRRLAIHLTLYGNEEISRRIWEAGEKKQGKEFSFVPNVGDSAYLQDRGPKNGYFATARYLNAHIFMTDLDGTFTTQGVVVTRRAINWNLAKWVFRNMDEHSVLPVPDGLATSIDELKSGQ